MWWYAVALFTVAIFATIYIDGLAPISLAVRTSRLLTCIRLFEEAVIVLCKICGGQIPVWMGSKNPWQPVMLSSGRRRLMHCYLALMVKECTIQVVRIGLYTVFI